MARLLLLPLLLSTLSLTGCKTTPSYMYDHPIVGTWEYEAEGLYCTRRFARNGVVTLTIDGKDVWSVAWHPASATEVVAVMENGRRLRHEILSTGRLNVQDLYIATRKSY